MGVRVVRKALHGPGLSNFPEAAEAGPYVLLIFGALPPMGGFGLRDLGSGLRGWKCRLLGSGLRGGVRVRGAGIQAGAGVKS